MDVQPSNNAMQQSVNGRRVGVAGARDYRARDAWRLPARAIASIGRHRDDIEAGIGNGCFWPLISVVRLQMAALDTAQKIEDMDIPGYRLHPLKGKAKGRWSVWVSGNWRLTFEFKDGNVNVLDYEDYH